MNLSNWLNNSFLTPRELTPEELQEMERQIKMQAPSPGEEVVRKAQRALASDPWNKQWWEYPLLNRPYTTELPKPKYSARRFSTRLPVLLSPQQKKEQDSILRRLRDQEQAQELAKEKNPLVRAWKYYMEAGAY